MNLIRWCEHLHQANTINFIWISHFKNYNKNFKIDYAITRQDYVSISSDPVYLIRSPRSSTSQRSAKFTNHETALFTNQSYALSIYQKFLNLESLSLRWFWVWVLPGVLKLYLTIIQAYIFSLYHFIARKCQNHWIEISHRVTTRHRDRTQPKTKPQQLK